jgi:hypothetical protein
MHNPDLIRARHDKSTGAPDGGHALCIPSVSFRNLMRSR